MMQYQIFHRKPWWSKFFYIHWERDELYGYQWHDYVAAIGPLQIRWRGKFKSCHDPRQSEGDVDDPR